MATVATLKNGIALGAPVVIVEGSLLVHQPTFLRLGRGTLRKPISYYQARGQLPVRWTTVCGRSGVVVLNRGSVLEQAEACLDCELISMGEAAVS